MVHDRVCGVVLTAEIGGTQAAAKQSGSQAKAFEVKGVDHRELWCL